MIYSCSVTMVEGTVSSLLEDIEGNIVGVEYRDKATGDKKVIMNNEMYKINLLNTHCLCVLLSVDCSS